jgi:hypothetical protein
LLWSSPLIAGAALVVAIPLVMRVAPHDMRDKGTETSVAAIVSLECTRGPQDFCSREGMLLFRVESVRERAYLAAYAEPVEGGERTWLFPSGPDLSEPVLEPGADPEILRKGVKLESLSEGRYDVCVVLGPRPVSRDEALAPETSGLFVEHLGLSVGP